MSQPLGQAKAVRRWNNAQRAHRPTKATGKWYTVPGFAVGDAAFVARLEELSGRFLAPRKGGRPKKALKDGGQRKHG
jgi:hypothetical protein